MLISIGKGTFKGVISSLEIEGTISSVATSVVMKVFGQLLKSKIVQDIVEEIGENLVEDYLIPLGKRIGRFTCEKIVHGLERIGYSGMEMSLLNVVQINENKENLKLIKNRVLMMEQRNDNNQEWINGHRIDPIHRKGINQQTNQENDKITSVQTKLNYLEIANQITSINKYMLNASNKFIPQPYTRDVRKQMMNERNEMMKINKFPTESLEKVVKYILDGNSIIEEMEKNSLETDIKCSVEKLKEIINKYTEIKPEEYKKGKKHKLKYSDRTKEKETIQKEEEDKKMKRLIKQKMEQFESMKKQIKQQIITLKNGLILREKENNDDNLIFIEEYQINQLEVDLYIVEIIIEGIPKLEKVIKMTRKEEKQNEKEENPIDEEYINKETKKDLKQKNIESISINQFEQIVISLGLGMLSNNMRKYFEQYIQREKGEKTETIISDITKERKIKEGEKIGNDQKFKNYINQIELWTLHSKSHTLFKSEKYKWEQNNSSVSDSVIGKNRLVFIIEDTFENVFGCYINETLINNQNDEKQWKSITINDPNAFVFSLKSKGYYNPMKFPIKENKQNNASISMVSD